MPVTRNDELQAAVDALSIYSLEEAARQCGLSYNGFRDRIKSARAQGLKPSIPPAAIRRVKDLEKHLAAARRAADKNTIIERLIGAVAEGVNASAPPRWVLDLRDKPSAPGVPTLFVSDLHWGERVDPKQINNVNRYDAAIAHRRLRTLAESAIHLLKIISPTMDYPGIVVPLGGDMVSGDIHDELVATNEMPPVEAVVDLHGALKGLIETMADTFGHVFLPCVTGNHGRNTRKTWAKNRHRTSYDWLLYRFLASTFANDKRVSFLIPDGPDAYYRIYDYRYLLTHGDQFRGGDSMIGALGPITRGDHKKRSRNAQIGRDYDTMIIGHWHQYIHLLRLIVNGSLKGYDEYASRENFGFEPPQQALWLTHPRYKITYRMPVYVERGAQSAVQEWTSWQAN